MSVSATNCKAALFRRTGAEQGRSVYEKKGVFPAFFIEHVRSSVNGGSEELSEILLPPEAAPVPGDELEVKGARYRISGVRSCVDASGKLRGFRCTFLR